MIRRTTIELDYDLLERAKGVLKCDTARATIHEALRRALDGADLEESDPPRGSAAAIIRDFETMHEHIDLEVLASNEMWR